MRAFMLLSCAALLVAADPAAATLDELRAANAARAELARETAAWQAEEQRLSALIAATRHEAERLARAATAAEAEQAAAAQRLAALDGAAVAEALRDRLAIAGAAAAQRLAALAATLPPGIVQPGDDQGFDAVARALDAAERAAAAVAVEVVTGTRDGRTEAVKLLRVAGAAAWWVALDGSAAGTAARREGALHLTAVPGPPGDAIRAALAQAEGRAQPGIVVLP